MLAALSTVALLAPTASALPATAAPPDSAREVHLVGTLQSELGCAIEGVADCAATALAPAGPTGVWSGTFAVPAGSYEFQIDVGGTRIGDPDAGNTPIPLVLEHPARLTFTYENRSRTIQITSPEITGVDGEDDREIIEASFGLGGERSVTYALVVDRFFDGDPENNDGGLGADPSVSGYLPGDLDYFQGGDIAGVTQQLDYIAGLGVDIVALSPVFAGDAVRGSGADFATGYDGQWGEDLTALDPRFGTEADLRHLTQAADERGLAVHLEVPAGTSEAATAAAEIHWAQFGVSHLVRPEERDPEVRDNLAGWLRMSESADISDVAYADTQGRASAISGALKGRIGVALRDVENPVWRVGLGLDISLLTQERPVIYYGDEQGFLGAESGNPSHEPMGDRFDTSNPLYQRVARLTDVRDNDPALGRALNGVARGGGNQSITANTLDPATGLSYLLHFSNAADGRPEFTTTTGNREVDRLYEARDNYSTTTVERQDIATYAGANMQAVNISSYARSTIVYRDIEPVVQRSWPAHPFLTVTASEDVMTLQAAALRPEGDPWWTSVRNFGDRPPVNRLFGYAVRPLGASTWQPLSGTVDTIHTVTHDLEGIPRGTVLEYRTVGDGGAGSSTTSGASALAIAGVDLLAQGGDAIALPGTHSDPDWSASPSSGGAPLLLQDPESGRYWAAAPRDAGVHEYVSLPGGHWESAVGRDGTPSGAPVSYEHPGGRLVTVHDPVTGTTMQSAGNGILTVAGSWNEHSGTSRQGGIAYRGLAGDDLTQLLTDPDGDGVWTWTKPELAAGTYQVKVAENLATAMFEFRGSYTDPAAVAMEHPGGPVMFSYNIATGVLSWTNNQGTGPGRPVEPDGPGNEPTVFLTNSGGSVPEVEFHVPARDEVFSGDWDGDGVDTLGWRHGSTYYLAGANAEAGGQVHTVDFGSENDEVFFGDWDGDGTDTPAVRRGNQFFVYNTFESGGGEVAATFYYGTSADEPIVGDWDGDGKDTISVRRGNQIHISNSLRSGNAEHVFYYGKPGERLLAGDFDGNGGDSLAIRRDEHFHLKNSLRSGNADRVVRFGQASDIALLGDWDGDGRDTVGVLRRSR